MDRVPLDMKNKIKKLIFWLEDIGSQLSRIDKVPSDEKKAWKIIDKHVTRIKTTAQSIVDSKETTDMELIKNLKKILQKDIVLYWSFLANGLKNFF